MNELKTYNILFLCHDNAGRSLMAEAMMNKIGEGRFITYSAGSQPAKLPHPIAIEILKEEGFDTSMLVPKSVTVFDAEEAPQMDLVITLCEDSKKATALNEWQGQPVTAHWHFEDPHQEAVNQQQDHDDEYHHYQMLQRTLSNRLRLLKNFPNIKLDEIALHH